MDSKNLAIGVLSTTAVILLVGLILVHTRPEPASAAYMNAQGGDYLLTTGQMNQSQELLYLIDANQQRMVVYRFDINRKQMNAGPVADLTKLREIAGDQDPQGQQQNPRSRTRGRGRR